MGRDRMKIITRTLDALLAIVIILALFLLTVVPAVMIIVVLGAALAVEKIIRRLSNARTI